MTTPQPPLPKPLQLNTEQPSADHPALDQYDSEKFINPPEPGH